MTAASASPYDRVLADARLRARFLAAYRGASDPMDALLWLDSPDEPGPSGAVSPHAALDAARRALYRPGADAAAAARVQAEADRLRHEHALTRAAFDEAEAGSPDGVDAVPAAVGARTPHRPAGRRRPSRRRPRRRTVIAATLATALVAALAIAEIGHSADQRRRADLIVPIPLEGSGDAAAAETERRDLDAVFRTSNPLALGQYFTRHPSQRPTQLVNVADGYARRATGPGSFAVDLTGGGDGDVTLFILCRTPAAYTWSLAIDTRDAAAKSTRRVVRGEGDDCSTLAYSAVVLGPTSTATTLRVTLPDSADYLVETTVSR